MLRSLSGHERKWIWWLAAAGGISRLLLAFRSDALLTTRPYIEDSFYAFSCARNLAKGLGFSVDGVHPTNGVQPLICLLYTPCFWVTSDKWLALRFTFVITALIAVTGVLLIAELLTALRRKEPKQAERWWQSPPVIAALTWVISAPILVHNSNGLETGLAADLILASLLVYQREFGRAPSFSRAIGFGVLLGLMVLARIDCSILVAAFALHELYRRPKESGFQILVYCTTALVITLPWWIYSYQTFGALMPISGQSEAVGNLLGLNAQQTVAALTDILSIFFYHNYFKVSFIVQLVAFFVLVQLWVLAFRSVKLWGRLRIRYRLQVLVPLILFGLALLVYYNFWFGAPHFIARYLNPLRIVWVIVFAAVLPIIFEQWKVKRASAGIRALGKLAIVVIAIFSGERYLNNFTTSQRSEFYAVGEWALARPSKSVGMNQSGTTGFMAPNIVNLDGKVNFEALQARLQGKEGEYVALRKFDYLADWPQAIRPLVTKSEAAGAFFVRDTTINTIEIFRAANR